MAQKKQKRAATAAPGGPVDIFRLAPVVLSAADVARVGILTASVDAARNHPALIAAKAAATTLAERDEVARARAKLAKRTYAAAEVADDPHDTHWARQPAPTRRAFDPWAVPAAVVAAEDAPPF
ncbi:hypothetical protein GCM10023081_38230 [Arthrobacter ginkgonis]|uniref:Uncharacterized protein n=1 Tax=Arthrobacter ginkgonis TaxID=1630594 RepID=A0ABP7D094_9MICC